MSNNSDGYGSQPRVPRSEHPTQSIPSSSPGSGGSAPDDQPGLRAPSGPAASGSTASSEAPSSAPAPFSAPAPARESTFAFLSKNPSDQNGEPVLNTAIALAAVGVMAIIAAIGMGFLFSDFHTFHNGGGPVLISVGLIVLLAGGVLIYAALKGQRPGWFLPFTIVGAIVALPVAAGGAALSAYTHARDTGVWDSAEGFQQFTWDEDGNRLTIDGYGNVIEVDEYGNLSVTTQDTEAGPVLMDGPIRRLDPTVEQIDAYEERVALDLTAAERGTSSAFEVDLDASELTIYLRQDQLPLVSQWAQDGMSSVTAKSLSLLPDDQDTTWQLQSWVESGFERQMYPFGLGDSSTRPANKFSFDLATDNWSTVSFVVVSPSLLEVWAHNQTTLLEEAQSGADDQKTGSGQQTDGGN